MHEVMPRTINDRFTLVAPLGSGSYGVVYEAVDAADPSRPVALKVLTARHGPRPGDSPSPDRSRAADPTLDLAEEFRILANLWHPNLARVLDFGVDRATGAPFYTMELIRGRDFVAAARGIDGPALIERVAQGLRALAYIHARGIVHGDLKPANLLVRDLADPDGAGVEDRVKLVDFGLARSPTDASRSPGGTALYWAPELARGGRASTTSDLYAFGALVYHAACGQPPFTGTAAEVIEAHRTRPPRPVRALRREVPDALEAVLPRLLAKDPQDRYASARDVLETLARLSGIDIPLETPQTRATRLISAPYVGRVAELERLSEQVDHLVSGRPHAGLILITGEAGIGKTRLARELSHRLQIYGVEVFPTACPRDGAGAFRPLVEPLARLYRTAPQALRSMFAADVGQVVGGLAAGAPPATTTRPGEEGAARGQLMCRLADFLVERARTPIAFLVDDLQHADGSTLDLLACLAPRTGRAGSGRILAVAMARDEAPAGGDGTSGPAWSSFLERARPMVVPLVGLGPEEVLALARGLSALGDVPEEVGRRLHELSAGNPSFVEEVVRLAEEERGAGAAGVADVTGLAAGLPTTTPRTIRRVLEARLARLGGDTLAVAQAMAAFGRPVPTPSIVAVLDLTVRQVEAALLELARRRLARPEEESTGTWALVPTTLAEILLASTQDEGRRSLHGRIAPYLQVLAGEGREHLHEEVAHHYRQAGRQAQALEHTLHAARRNARLFNYEAAQRLFTVAAGLADRSDTPLRRAIEEELSAAAEAAGDAETALQHLDTARRMAEEASDTKAIVRILGHLGRIHTARGDLLRAMRPLKEAAGRAVLPQDAHEYASVCRQLAVLFLDSAKPEMARDYCRRGLEALGKDEAAAGPGLTFTLGLVHAARGRRAEAIEHWGRAADLAQRLGEPVERVRALLALAEEHLARGDIPRARTLADTAQALVTERRDVPRQSAIRGVLAEIAIHEGDLARAQEEVEESVRLAERMGYVGLTYCAHHTLAALERARGHYAAALEHLWQTFHGHRKHSPLEEFSLAFRERALGHLYLDLGDLKKARSFLHRARVRAEGLGMPDLLGTCILSTGTLELRERRLARAEADLREAFGILERLGHRVASTRALLLLAELDLTRGELRRAAERARRALTTARAVSARPLAVAAQTLLGRTLALDPARRAEGRQALEEAAREALVIDFPELICRAHHWLGQCLAEEGQIDAAREAYRDAVLALQRLTDRLAPEQAAAFTAEEQRSRLLAEWASLRDAPAPAPCTPDVPRSGELVQAIARLNRQLDPEAIVDALLAASLSLTGAERAAIVVRAPEGGALSVRNARAPGGVRLSPADVVPSRTLVERALAEDRPIIANDTPLSDVPGDFASEPVPATASIVALDLKSVLALPLKHQGVTTGVLYLDSHSVARTFAPLDLELLVLLGHHAAIAFDNAVAYRQIEELRARLQSENLYLREEIEAAVPFTEIVGSSTALGKALTAVDRVARTDATVLLRGETGTGKELFARAIHSRSPRADKPLIKVNLSALPPDLIESELFGHEKGAFTGAGARRIGRFELASGGTIFLDEIGDLPLPIQVKLLRVLQEREFERLGASQTLRADCRVIAATNRDLEDLIRRGAFREDLFYRLNVFPIVLPPLRERGQDVLEIAAHLIARAAKKLGRTITAIDEPTRRVLLSYAWPGNVRELSNVLERACILARRQVLTVDTLPEGLGSTAATPSASPTPPAHGNGQGLSIAIPEGGINLARTLRDVKVHLVKEALARTGGNQAQAALLLGLQRSNLNRLIKDLQIG